MSGMYTTPSQDVCGETSLHMYMYMYIHYVHLWLLMCVLHVSKHPLSVLFRVLGVEKHI